MDKKITKIWYWIIAVLVILASLVYVFRGGIFMYTKSAQPTEPVEIQEPVTPTEEVKPQIPVEENQKDIQKDMKKAEETVSPKQDAKKEVKPNIQQELPAKKIEPSQVTTEKIQSEPVKTEDEPQANQSENGQNLGTTTIQQTSRTVTQNGGTSEVVEIRYMYKSNPKENVLYRGVWYNIKTKTLEENGNGTNINTIPATTENESK